MRGVPLSRPNPAVGALIVAQAFKPLTSGARIWIGAANDNSREPAGGDQTGTGRAAR